MDEGEKKNLSPVVRLVIERGMLVKKQTDKSCFLFKAVGVLKLGGPTPLVISQWGLVLTFAQQQICFSLVSEQK